MPCTPRCMETETRAQRGADSAIGDFRRAFGRILQLHPPLAAKTLACTDWVAFHYICRTRTCAHARATVRYHHKPAAIGFKFIGTSKAPSFNALFKSAGTSCLSPAKRNDPRSAGPIQPIGEFNRGRGSRCMHPSARPHEWHQVSAPKILSGIRPCLSCNQEPTTGVLTPSCY